MLLEDMVFEVTLGGENGTEPVTYYIMETINHETDARTGSRISLIREPVSLCANVQKMTLFVKQQ